MPDDEMIAAVERCGESLREFHMSDDEAERNDVASAAAAKGYLPPLLCLSSAEDRPSPRPRLARRWTVAVPTSPDNEAVALMRNEYEITTRSLSCCDCVRKAVKMGEFREFRNALFLERAEGVALDAWTAAERRRLRDDGGRGEGRDPKACFDLAVVRVMREVAAALAEIHEAGVVHHDLVSENIVVNFERGGAAASGDEKERRKDRDRCEVKIIGFGLASRLVQAEFDDGGGRANDDLYALGELYRNLLRDIFCDGESTITAASTGFDFGSSPVLPPRVPRPLVSIVENLLYMDISSDTCTPIETAREVEQDLSQMVDDPARFLFETRLFHSGEKPDLRPRKLYGRTKEVSSLLATLDRVGRRFPHCKTPQEEAPLPLASHGELLLTSECVLLSGLPGTGKSALAEQLRGPTEAIGGHFVTGKFDQMNSRPYSAFSSAFGQVCEEICSMPDSGETRARVQKAIMDEVGDSWHVLIDVVPNIHRIFGWDSPSLHKSMVTGEFSEAGFHYIFMKFTRAVASELGPFVLFLDDLQWADCPSFALLKALISNSGSESSGMSILFVVAFRRNEVVEDHPLSECLRVIEGNEQIQTSRIEVGNLSHDAINDMISDSLRMSRRLTRGLADIVLQKTLGNSFFAIQWLRTLCDDGLLTYSVKEQRWRWDKDIINVKSVSDNVVDLMTQRMLKLSATTQDALKVLACLGSQFEQAACRLVFNSCSNGVPPASQGNMHFPSNGSIFPTKEDMELLIQEGIIEKIDSGSSYRFAHDQIHQASYSLIAPGEQAKWHYEVGERIWRRASSAEMKCLVFVIANQMNHGAALVEDVAKRVELARLNYNAGRQAMSSSAFSSAASYFQAGITVLDSTGSDHWESEYELSLCLFEASADAEYCCGNFDQMEPTLHQVYQKAVSLHDKFRCHMIHVKSFAAQSRQEEAIMMGFRVLSDLGVPFPRKINKRVIVIEMLKTRSTLRGNIASKIMTLPEMAEGDKKYAMELLGVLLYYGYLAKIEVVPLIALRMVRLTMKHGICPSSPVGFMFYASLLCKLGYIRQGYKYGKIGMYLLEKITTIDWHCKTLVTYHLLVHHWASPLQESINPLLDAREFGMKTGDVEWAATAEVSRCVVSFYAGKPLPHVDEEMRAAHKTMSHHGQTHTIAYHEEFWQMVQNLQNKSPDPLELSGEIINKEKTTEIMATDRLRINLHFLSLMLACFFGNHEVAVEHASKCSEVPGALFAVSRRLFFYALSSIGMARAQKQVPWRKIAKESMKKLHKFDSLSSGNRHHNVLLLRAEYASITGKPCENMYNAAVASASESGFIHDEALANEKAGMFYLGCSKTCEATTYLAQAMKCYLTWGATAKVEQMRSKYSFLTTK